MPERDRESSPADPLVYWQILSWIPPENSVAGRGYWAPIRDDDGRDHWDEQVARRFYAAAQAYHDRLALARVTRDVVGLFGVGAPGDG